MNNRNVILTGAGAVIPWGAPNTDKLTEILRKDSTFINDRRESIGEYIYSLLLSQKEKRRGYHTPNFETMLHFVELLFEYRRSQYSMSDSFFQLNDFFLIDFKIKNSLETFESKNPNFYSLSNNNLAKYLDTAFDSKRLVENEYFYYELYLHFTFLIKKEIEKYEINGEHDYCELNKGFNQFLNQIKGEKGIVRFYTLNYDYLFPNISNMEFFDGYDKVSGKIDEKRIIEDDNVDCYYHLHGSFKLNLIGEKSNDYSISKVQRSFVQNDFIPSNIITGYNKPERIFNDIFYEFYQKMIEDFITADRIFIIGYSFNDMHVNAALRRAIKKGNVEITVVDKCSIEDFGFKYSKITGRNMDYNMHKLIKEPNTYQMTTEATKAKAYLNGLNDFIGMR
ncbi:MAG: SIR2 family protein [Bacteroidales bacterium]|nr:SIR2 family protein [Bacteroidales bacterium]